MAKKLTKPKKKPKQALLPPGAENGEFASRVYSIVRKCPRGKVVSYGGVAAMLGKPRAARAVGSALNRLDPDTDVPWWRVINTAGSISHRGSGALIQERLLRREGVRFIGGRIDWDTHGWDGRTAAQ